MARFDETEYGDSDGRVGGGVGGAPRFSDGSSLELTASQRARIIRAQGLRPMVNRDPVEFLRNGEPEGEDIKAQRAELERNTNRYNREVDPD